MDKLKYLNETNGDCALPCLWGIEPGETEWYSVEPFLQSFATSLTHGWGSPEYAGVIYRAEYPSIVHPDQTLATLFYVASAGPKKDKIEIISTLSNHPLSHLITILGEPNQVWINLEPLDAHYSLVISYQAGEMLFYGGFYTHDQNDNFVICSTDLQKKNSALWLWDPLSGKSWQDIAKLSTILPPLTSSNYFRSLEELTDLSTKDFYNLFLESSSSRCVKISSSRWYNNP